MFSGSAPFARAIVSATLFRVIFPPHIKQKTSQEYKVAHLHIKEILFILLIRKHFFLFFFRSFQFFNQLYILNTAMCCKAVDYSTKILINVLKFSIKVNHLLSSPIFLKLILFPILYLEQTMLRIHITFPTLLQPKLILNPANIN